MRGFGFDFDPRTATLENEMGDEFGNVRAERVGGESRRVIEASLDACFALGELPKGRHEARLVGLAAGTEREESAVDVSESAIGGRRLLKKCMGVDCRRAKRSDAKKTTLASRLLRVRREPMIISDDLPAPSSQPTEKKNGAHLRFPESQIWWRSPIVAGCR